MSNEAPTDALRLVPVKPTEAMLEAAWAATRAATSEQRMLNLLGEPKAGHDLKMKTRWAAMLAAAPASPLPGGGWQDISTAPKDGTLFLGCDLDHPSFGSWPMYRRVKHGFNGAGEVLTQDMGAWIKIIDVEPDFEGGSDVGFEPQYAIAADDLNKSVRYGWKSFPIPETPTKAEAK